MTELYWLPAIEDWRARALALQKSASPAWEEAIALANARLDFVQTNALDAVVAKAFPEPPVGLAGEPLRLAMLGSSTMTHLQAAIRVAGLRRGLWIRTYEAAYGQYWQELTGPGSELHRFRPNVVLLALDAHHLAAGINADGTSDEADRTLAEWCERIRGLWRLARDSFHCAVIHQLSFPAFPALLGNNEHRLPGSRAAFLSRLNEALRRAADEEGVDLLALDSRAAADGLGAWHNPVLWHRAKQEVTPAAAPMYGELVARLIGARQGRSFKCLVLDLDNTLWGGVVGDDGVEGLVIGQGSALGEAYADFQEYARELSRRGIVLAACSKNDEANALEPFDRHPDMVLRRSDFSAIAANWDDKPANIRAIADELNLGLDALVFVDDNPFERELVRRELPMVAVPELSDDPAGFALTLADAGYFESVAITAEDRARTGQYQTNRQRESLRASSTDLSSYLRSLEMQLLWRRIDEVGLDRIVQLINKTNQFNLTTRRYDAAAVLAIMRDPRAMGLQLRLVDRFGDNGIVAVVIGRMAGDDLVIDTWLMSCRVLGRQVEAATLNLIAAAANEAGARRLVGEYLPTAKNRMVRDHYAKLGFTQIDDDPTGAARSVLELAGYVPRDTFVELRRG